MARSEWKTTVSWSKLEAQILSLIGEENAKARSGDRPFPASDLAWSAIRLLKKVREEGIGSLLPVDQAWLRELRSRYETEGAEGLKRALDLDRPQTLS